MITLWIRQYIIVGICIIFITLVGTSASYVGWQWRKDWLLSKQILTEQEAVSTHQEATALIAAIPDAHLFGKSINKMGHMPLTNLHLHVTGIVKMVTEKSKTSSKAYISLSGQPSKIYKIGDSLAYGVKIYDILADAVILENNGHLEKLPLPREQLKFKSKITKERV